MNHPTIKVVAQLTVRRNLVSLIAEQDVFPYHKGDIVKQITRKTYDKLPKKKGEPLVLVLRARQVIPLFRLNENL